MCGRRQIGHFIEKERPLVGVLELPAATAHARRRAFLDSKELGLEQGLDDRGAVDGDEGALAPATELVNLPVDDVPSTVLFAFAGTRIVGRVSIRHALNPYLERFGGQIG